LINDGDQLIGDVLDICFVYVSVKRQLWCTSLTSCQTEIFIVEHCILCTQKYS